MDRKKSAMEARGFPSKVSTDNILIGLRRMRGEVEEAIRNDKVDDETRRDAKLAVNLAIGCLVLETCGDDVIRLAQNADVEETDPLFHIIGRIIMVLPLLKSDNDRYGQELALEAIGVASGDPPKVFAQRSRVKGKTNTYRIARLQLEALKWEQYMVGQKTSPAKRQSALVSAFNLTYDTIRSWKKDCIQRFGEDVVDEELSYSRRRGEEGISPTCQRHLGLFGLLGHESVELTAAAYWDEKRWKG